MAAYYPRRTATLEDLKMAFKKYDFEVVNPEEEDRFESIAIAKLRGKGPPKKKREKDSEFNRRHGVDQLLIPTCACSIQAEKKEMIHSNERRQFIRQAAKLLHCWR